MNASDGAGRTLDAEPRHNRHGGMLYALLLVAAIAVIVFSVIGIATMTGVVSNAANSAPLRPNGSEAQPGHPQRLQAPQREPIPRPGNPRTAWIPVEKTAL